VAFDLNLSTSELFHLISLWAWIMALESTLDLSSSDANQVTQAQSE